MYALSSMVIALTLMFSNSVDVHGYSVKKLSSSLDSMQDTTIFVNGNCSSCKKAIEKAAKSLDGVEKASWDKKSKILNISYDRTKTSLNMIEKAIIAIGYDTENLRADDEAYEGLHQCCKYERNPPRK